MYIALFCTLLFALCNAEKTFVDAPVESTRFMVEKSRECIAKTGADSEILQRLFKLRTAENNETAKNFYLCLFKNTGMCDNAGHFYVDKVLDLFASVHKKDEIENVTVECNKIVAENPSETMYQNMQCMYEKLPVLLRFPTE